MSFNDCHPLNHVVTANMTVFNRLFMNIITTTNGPKSTRQPQSILKILIKVGIELVTQIGGKFAPYAL